MRYLVSFDRWEDYVRGLDITSVLGEVVCRPKWTINISDSQKKSLDDAQIRYSMVS